MRSDTEVVEHVTRLPIHFARDTSGCDLTASAVAAKNNASAKPCPGGTEAFLSSQ